MSAIIIESEQEVMVNTKVHAPENGQRFSLPPLYTWPASLKRMALTAGIVACLGAYGLFIGGVLGAVFLFLQFAFKG